MTFLPWSPHKFVSLQITASCRPYRPIKCRTDQERLQRDLSALQDWADRLGMCFKPSRCSVLRVSRPKYKNLEFEYTLKGETLANVSSTPYLGVCLSDTLEREAHINEITSKANSTPSFLRRNLKACRPKLRETAYFSLVRSSLEYSSAVGEPFRQKYIDKLEKIKDQQQDLSPQITDKQPVWLLSFRTWVGLTWKQDVKNLDL